jgi:hypothetical protein
MRYAAAYKPDAEPLDQFIQRKGINAWAAGFTRWAKGFGQNRRIESGPGSELVALPSMAAITPRAGMMLRCDM